MKRFTASVLAAVVMAACSDAPISSPRSTIDLPAAARSTAPVSTPIPGHYIVVFKNNVVNVSSMATMMAGQHQSNVDRVYSTAIKGFAAALSASEAAAMAADPNVAFVEQDQTMTLQGTQTGVTWGIDRTDQRALPLNTTYVYGADGTGVTAYIIDTGISYTHTEFGGRAVKGIDEVTPGGTAADCLGHGSGVASLVGGAKYGVAKNVKLVAVRVVDCNGSITTSTVIAGVDWVTANRKLPAVANVSMSVLLSAALTQSIENSIASGVVYAVAAGNNSNDACTMSPANTPDAITVGATNKFDQYASFSSFGPCVDISAPGEAVKMAWFGSNTATNTSNGTSFASPHVAGTAALYLQGHPTATPAQVRSALVSNATTNVLTNVPSNTPNLLLYSGFITAPQTTVANFTSTCLAFNCTFDASSSTATPSASYAWTYGDGATGIGKTSAHTYAAAGTYSVKLTVSDANGTSTKTTSVAVAAANQAPVAHFSFSCPTLACTFDASASTDNVGIVSYTWTWGDGRGETHAGPIAKNAYFAVGTYFVSLTVTDGSGLTSLLTTSVQVPSAPTNTAPMAVISTPINGATFVQGATVAFGGTGNDAEDGTLSGSSLTWSSNLDGQIGTGTSFSTSSLSVGTHVITLTARDAQGLTGLAARTITITAPVNQPPVASFTWTCSGTAHKCLFDASASTDDHGVVSYTWDWGGGKSETHAGSGANNTWLAGGGPQTVTLTVKDASGLTDSITHTVIVP